MRQLATCVLASVLFAGTSAMAAGGSNTGETSSANSPAPAEPAAAGSPAAPATPGEERMEAELQELRDLLLAQSKKFHTENEQLKSELEEQREKVQALEEQISAARVADAEKSVNAPASLTAASIPSSAAGAALSAGGMTPAPSEAAGDAKSDEWKKIYDGGFYIESSDKAFSLHVNGLFQPRFTEFVANANAQALGAPTSNVDNFDIFLGRLVLSGNIFDPSIKYFVQFQGSTSGNTIGTNFIDWFAQKTFSNAFTVQMGRAWTPYSLENLDSPGQYLMADFSSAEYAFALSRAVGFEAQGQIGKFGYAVMIANAIPGLDAPGQLNFNNKLAYIGHVQYDILGAYGYQESDPSPEGAPRPELTIWSSGAYNPVVGASAFSNESTGDSTVGATTTVGLRVKYFTLQNTGFYRDTKRVTHAPDFNSWGYAEQAGYYVVPGKFELTGRVSGVNWGAPDFTGVTPGSETNTWYSGPNFPFHRVTEHTFGANYYVHGHNAKLQTDYSYLTGNTFSGVGFTANRVWLQAQIMF